MILVALAVAVAVFVVAVDRVVSDDDPAGDDVDKRLMHCASRADTTRNEWIFGLFVGNDVLVPPSNSKCSSVSFVFSSIGTSRER